MSEVVETNQKVLYKFTPVDSSIHDSQSGVDYVLGMQYVLREGNLRLATRCQQWLDQGKIKKVPGSTSTINGES